MSVYELYSELWESDHGIICRDRETGEEFTAPEELPVDLASEDEWSCDFFRQRG